MPVAAFTVLLIPGGKICQMKTSTGLIPALSGLLRAAGANEKIAAVGIGRFISVQ